MGLGAADEGDVSAHRGRIPVAVALTPVGFGAAGPGKHLAVPPWKENPMGFMDEAKDFADKHDEQVDQGLEKAGDQVDDRTGNKYSDKIDKGVDEAQERTGAGDTQQQ